MSTSASLGQRRSVPLPQATVEYYERGDGPTLVFVHGVLANADIWQKVVPSLAESGYRCITPDLPLGAHTQPVADRSFLNPPGVADLLADFLEAANLDDVTLVTVDTGGAFSQILMTRRPERVGRVVITNGDSFERFFPPTFALLPYLIRIPGAPWLTFQALRLPLPGKSTFLGLSKHKIAPEILRSFATPARVDAAVRGDAAALLRTINKRHTLAAAKLLPAFDKPVLLAWGPEDKMFPVSLAHRLAALLPDARIREIPDAYCFVPLDQPQRLARLIAEFVPRTTISG